VRYIVIGAICLMVGLTVGLICGVHIGIAKSHSEEGIK